MSRTHPRWNNQLSQFFSDGLGATKAEDTFGNGIEFSDASGGVHSDDAIEREIEDCASAIERIRFFSWITPSALVLSSFPFFASSMASSCAAQTDGLATRKQGYIGNCGGVPGRWS